MCIAAMMHCSSHLWAKKMFDFVDTLKVEGNFLYFKVMETILLEYSRIESVGKVLLQNTPRNGKGRE